MSALGQQWLQPSVVMIGEEWMTYACLQLQAVIWQSQLEHRAQSLKQA